MAPWRENTSLFFSSQHLPRLPLGPLKGFSRALNFEGPPLASSIASREIRVLSDVPGHLSKSNMKTYHLFDDVFLELLQVPRKFILEAALWRPFYLPEILKMPRNCVLSLNFEFFL